MKRLRNLVLDNFGLKAVSITLAILFFMYVRGDQDTVMSLSVRVVVKLPEGRLLSGDTVDQVRLTVSGKWSKIRDLGSRELQPLEIDLTSHQGDIFYFDEDQFRLPPGVKVVSFQPASTTVKTVEAASKRIPVRAVVTGNPDADVEFMSAVVNPQHTTILGTKEALKQIKSVETVPIDLAGRKETTSLKVSLVKPSRVQFEMAGDDGAKDVDVVLRFKDRIEKRAFKLPVRVVGIGGKTGFEAKPQEVEIVIEGAMRSLDSMDSDALMPYVDAADLNLRESGTYRLPLMVDNLPSGLKLVNRKPEIIHVTTVRKVVPDGNPVDRRGRGAEPGVWDGRRSGSGSGVAGGVGGDDLGQEAKDGE